MIEHWEKTLVSGSGAKVYAEEVVLHRRGEDAIVMAMRRNHEMTKCDTIWTDTEEVFALDIQDKDGRAHRRDIPHDDRREEWNW